MRNGPVHFISAIAIFAAALAGASLPATAEFRPTPSAWDGLYIGVHGGMGWANLDVAENPDNPFAYNGASDGWNYRPEGYLAGVHGGLNWESYRLLLGVEARYGQIVIEDNAADPASAGADTVSSVANGYYADVSGRIGFAPDEYLYYIRGGAAWADLDIAVTDSCGAGPCSTATIATEAGGAQNGWVIGGGFAYALTTHLSLRLDYSYYDFGEVTVSGDSGGDLYGWTHELTVQMATVGVSYNF
jgi:outer membrane immunogenic protein